MHHVQVGRPSRPRCRDRRRVRCARPARLLPPGGSITPAHPRMRARDLAAERLAGLDAPDIELFTIRLARWWPDLTDGWSAGLRRARRRGRRSRAARVGVLADRYRERGRRCARSTSSGSPPARLVPGPVDDRLRLLSGAGSAGRSRGVEEHLDYLEELGVRYLHLMPLLRAARRARTTAAMRSPTTGRSTRPRAPWTTSSTCATDLRERGMSLCIDLVLNHTAAEHPWAVRPREPATRRLPAMYRIFPDRTMPDRYEARCPRCSPTSRPATSPSSPDGRWVWTTFNRFQWDLDWSNPAVFVEMTDVLLDLANRGVEVFRLDAVAFMWKRLGRTARTSRRSTTCSRRCGRARGSPRRRSSSRPRRSSARTTWLAYLGVGRHHGRVSDLAYHNSLMVQFWSALATRDARLMTHVLRDLPRKPATTAWAHLHPLPRRHRLGDHRGGRGGRRLGRPGAPRVPVDFYAGRFPGSFARGERFQLRPATGDSRISGSFASLAGLEAALEAGDPDAVDRAIARIRLGHALIMAWDGVPAPVHGRRDRPAQRPALPATIPTAADNRWLHRPPMDWAAAARRHDPGRSRRGSSRTCAPDRGAARGAPAARGDPARGRRPRRPRALRLRPAPPAGRARGDPQLRPMRRSTVPGAVLPAPLVRAPASTCSTGRAGRRRPVDVPGSRRALARGRRDAPVTRRRAARRRSGSATTGGGAASSTRSTRAASPTATATGSATCPGSSTTSTTSGPDGLGVDAIWLSPIYPSPGVDVGYDVSDHDARRSAVRHARPTSTGWSPRRIGAASGSSSTS